jgi:ribosomal protein L40E
MNCVECGAKLRRGAKFCAKCGASQPIPIKCANCGAELRPDAKFCTKCGASQPALRTCTNCGARLRPSAKFCAKCGATQQAPSPPSAPPKAKTPKARWDWRWITVAIASLIVLLCVCGGALGLFAPRILTPESKPQAKEVASQTIRDDAGGTLVIDDPGSPLDGLEVEIPPGALGDGREITLSAGYVPDPPEVNLQEMAQDEPALLFQLTGHLEQLNAQEQDVVYHPFWTAGFMLAKEHEAKGPLLSLKPTGYQFEEPVRITISLENLALPESTDLGGLEVFVLESVESGGTTTWELVPDSQIDHTEQALTIQTDHLSLFNIIAYHYL